jgi:hypothetical protein
MAITCSPARLESLELQVRAAGKKALALYKRILREDGSAEFAAMCALRQAPSSLNSERAFSEGAARQTRNMPELTRRLKYKAAKKAGIATQGKVHKDGLGPPSDPASWVSTPDDVLAVARARNLTVEGVVNHKGVEYEGPRKTVALAPEIVDRFEREYRQGDPGLDAKVRRSPKARRELREKIIDTHGSRRKRAGKA